MTLTLALSDGARLANGSPGELVLHRRGAIVGRAPTCDWVLPDPAKHISSRHCQIAFDGRDYVLTDTSTNGTFLNGASVRMTDPHVIAQGDRLQIGPLLIEAKLTGAAVVAPAASEGEAGVGGWAGWQGGADAGRPDDPSPSPSPSSGGWDAAPTPPAVGVGSGWEPAVGPSLARPEAHREQSVRAARSSAPQQSGWAPSAAASFTPAPSTWDTPDVATDSASGWSSAAPDRPAPPSPDDVWGRLAEGNVVDWARGGFGQPVAPPADPLGIAPPPAKASLPTARPSVSTPGVTVPPEPTAAPTPVAPVAPPGDDRTDALLHKLVAGLVVMVEARARAKAQLGAEATAFNPAGHNPLKFARSPDEAVSMLLDPPQRGFMEGGQAIEDAYRELQSHQMATLRAMQGALRATLDRFAPAAIRARADAGGVLERILPAARDAALWQAYEREFGGVAQGSDEAFMDVFAKEFREAYNDQARRTA